MICCVYRRGRIYWGKLQLEHELRLSRFSLGTTDKRIAQANLLRIATERQKEHAGLLPPKSIREAADEPVQRHLDAFLEDLNTKGRRPATLAKYRSNISCCITACHWCHLRDITARSFCDWRAACELSRKTVNDTLAALQTFCRWLVYQRCLLENPLSHVQRVDTRGDGTQYRRSLSTEELSALLSVASPLRRLVYFMAACTGLRRAELASLRRSDIVLDSALVRVRAAISKNRKDAVIPLHPELVVALREYFTGNEAPFTPVFRFIPRVSTLRRDLVAAGISFLDSEGRRADFHSLRVTFGTNLTLGGASPREVMELMRHSDIKLTMKIYTDAAKLPLAVAIGNMPSIHSKRLALTQSEAQGIVGS